MTVRERASRRSFASAAAAHDDSNDIELLRWDGTSMSAKTKIEETWGGQAVSEPIMIDVSEMPAIVRWREVSR